MSQSRMAVITFLDGGPVDPGYGQLPPSGGGHPSQGLPGLPPFAVQLPVFPFDPTRPDQGLPGSQPGPDQGLPSQPGRPSQGLPGSQPHPDQGVPGSGAHPDAGLPVPGKRYVVKWVACHGLILVPDQSLPAGPPVTPDQSLPPAPEPKK